MNVVLYTRQTAPHKPVDELSHLDSLSRRDGGPASCAGCEAHEADPTTNQVPYHATCAACSWTDTEVRKVARAKAVRLRAFQKTGKLHASWMKPRSIPKVERMTDEEAWRVVLPHFPVFKLRLYAVDLMIEDARPRYLQEMGETAVGATSPDFRFDVTWSCGCVTRAARCEACKRHKWALDGRDEE